MKKCVHCNKEYDDGKKFCPKCGSPLSFAAVPATDVMAEPAASDDNLHTAERAVMSTPDAPRKGAKPVAIGLAVAVILLLPLLGFLPLSGIALLAIFLVIFLVWIIKFRK